jgi:HAD superfamily hydrolase (TIGR01549 family)
MRLEGILFDIDGTLVDSNDLHAECWVEAFAKFGKRLDYSLVRHQIGKGGDLLVPDLLNAKEMQRFGEKVQKFRSKLFKEKYLPKVKPFDFVGQVFESLRENDVKIALASSSDPHEVKYYTRLLGVRDLIEGSTSKGDANLSKPSPEIFEAALKRAGTDPKFTFVVGDTPYDILAAHRCALPIVAVLSGGFERDLLKKAEFIFNDAGRVPAEYDKLNAYLEDE